MDLQQNTMFSSPIRDSSAARLAEAEKTNRENTERYLKMQFIVPRLRTFMNPTWQPRGCKNVPQTERKRGASRDRATELHKLDEYDENVSKCNPVSLTLSGFYSVSTEGLPDAVRCFACGVVIADWLESDSPNDEHTKSCAECPFVRRRFKPIELSSVRDYVAFDKSVKMSAARRYYEMVMAEMRVLERADNDALDRLAMAMDDVDCATETDTATTDCGTAAHSEAENEIETTTAHTNAAAKKKTTKTKKRKTRKRK